MNEQKLDRRVKYTMKSLKDALIELLQTEHISKISVKSLCELADVNRSTFYAHFKDQYDLLQHIETEILDNIRNYLRDADYNEATPISFQVLNRILEHIYNNTDVFRAFLSYNSDPDITEEIMKMTEIVPRQPYEDLDERTRDYLMSYSITGCISILQKWLFDGTPETPARMSEIIFQALNYTV